jgi:glycosyltransferase involved in cell wall biosynthesis
MTRARLCIVGSGTTFLSGISYYTFRLALAMAQHSPTTVILMRRLVPARLYPGRTRVGAELTDISYPPHIPTYDGVDWFWGATLARAVLFLRRHRPQAVSLQWWTGAVLHSYLMLAVAARLLGARIIIEFHEVQDTGEARIAPARIYTRVLGGLLLRMADGFVVHSEFDRELIRAAYRIGDRPTVTSSHGPHDVSRETARRIREAPEQACNLLFFGTIRPYKGLEDLVAAFDSLTEDQADGLWLTVVGETWEGWTLPLEMIERSPRADRITLVNHYVTDEEVAGHFQGADVVVLPYRRSSTSGPLHIATAMGLPTVVTAVGGLTEAAGDYDGVVFAEPADPAALAAALLQAVPLRGQRFVDPHSWERSVERYDELLRSIGVD